MPKPNAMPNASSSFHVNHQPVMRGSIEPTYSPSAVSPPTCDSTTGTAQTSASTMISVWMNSMYELARTPPSAV